MVDGVRSGNIALLIDADNPSCAGFEDVLAIRAELGTVNVRRAYGNWEKPGLKGWKALTHRYAIEPQQQFDVTKGKSATDMRMIIDAMDLLYGGRVNGFGLMSSDSDFMPLVTRLRQDGHPVYGFGGSKTPEGFRQACTRFIDVAALMPPLDDRPQGLPPALTALVAAPARSAAQAANTPPVVDDTVVAVLANAWKAAKRDERDERGYARLAEVGQLTANQSSFDARSYGYPRLSNLIAAIPQFTTELREDGMWLKRNR